MKERKNIYNNRDKEKKGGGGRAYLNPYKRLFIFFTTQGHVMRKAKNSK